MGKLFPDLVYGRLYDIKLDILHEKGIKNILIDLDNTLIRWKANIIDEKTIEWVNNSKEAGLKLCIVSNSNGNRAQAIAEKLDIKFIKNAAKPFGKGIRRAMEMLNADKTNTAIVGDQLFTDVLGGNRAGLFTVLLEPIHKDEFFYTKIVRIFERRKLKSLGLK
ncbi:MAG TPA: YqeG family HAD IIIA-type phosphatase [Clostridia bacterium]|nr:YqeG family HAD IIIA-type phosphatase [Clostridia bacterium]